VHYKFNNDENDDDVDDGVTYSARFFIRERSRSLQFFAVIIQSRILMSLTDAAGCGSRRQPAITHSWLCLADLASESWK